MDAKSPKNIPIDDHICSFRTCVYRNTAIKEGGTVYPLDILDEIATIAHRKMHMLI